MHRTFRLAYNQGVASYKSGKLEEAEEAFRHARDLSPHHLGALYNHACVLAMLGNRDTAMEMLSRVVAMGLDPGIRDDHDLESLRDLKEFEDLLSELRSRQIPVNSSTLAFSLTERDFIPEGIAYDPTSNAFFVGSVRKRKIVRVSSRGESQEFARDSRKALWSCMGLAVDQDRRLLWVAHASMPQMVGYAPEENGKSGLFAFDIDQETLERTIVLPSHEAAHSLNDLVVLNNGDVYVSDAVYHAIYRLSSGEDELELFLPAGSIESPQGLAVSPDNQMLFVASYPHGVYGVDLRTRAFSPLDSPDTISVTGIDGLVFYENSLLAIQNGVRPDRIVRYYLSEDRSSIRAASVLEMYNPMFDEPTLGGVAGRSFFFIANSQWGRFDKNGQLPPLDKLNAPRILEIRLENPH
jgi:tetratricopeptide (TPR) repeat protein